MYFKGLFWGVRLRDYREGVELKLVAGPCRGGSERESTRSRLMDWQALLYSAWGGGGVCVGGGAAPGGGGWLPQAPVAPQRRGCLSAAISIKPSLWATVTVTK